MNFLKAIHVAREEKVKIRRESWENKNCYINPDNEDGYMSHRDNGVRCVIPLTADDYLAEDWEIKMVQKKFSDIKPGDKFINGNTEYVKVGHSEAYAYRVRDYELIAFAFHYHILVKA